VRAVSKEEGGILKFVFGLFSGMISGIAIGLLLAPKKGEEFREDLKIKSMELKDLTKEKLSEFQNQGRVQAKKFANTVQE